MYKFLLVLFFLNINGPLYAAPLSFSFDTLGDRLSHPQGLTFTPSFVDFLPFFPQPLVFTFSEDRPR